MPTVGIPQNSTKWDSSIFKKQYRTLYEFFSVVVRWHAVASWTWDAQDETCGICRMAFDGFVPTVNFLGMTVH
ncbi:hypothetical protein L6164_010404 [Bauhinia variegata]|uniref:Uncharacterized protein n=1 Tax=Bauhinia variegata TaxID=167791 RepID=A0ACB9PM65_BAUVA|nr:hypothetical protein L6164_010404 [Bauhinia variegata]